ncbi:MAG: cell division protein FtsH [Clostridiales bacterium GWD2_32_59]|nr:MAG: cell division protein FtsH [Clostridiales bacterium GWD2_32_59]
MEKYFRGFGLYIIIFVIILLVAYMSQYGNDITTKEENYNVLITKLDEGKIEKLSIMPSEKAGMARVKADTIGTDTKKSTDTTGVDTIKAEGQEPSVRLEVNVPNLQVFMDYITKNILPKQPNLIIVTEQPESSDGLFQVLFITSIVIVFIVIISLFFGQMGSGGGGGSRVMSFGKSRAKLVVGDKNKINFTNVAGLDEEKEEVKEVVEFLKQPKKFIDIGARIPKGILLVGPPGTGKTLLAKAIAGEAGVPFFSISGSDFVEMFVGVGASRVRDLFEQAKKNSPGIIFIDEIDAVGRKRGAGLGGGHDEREQTLNQLLVEMDGFETNQGVIVIAATNRADILDPALLRPGRFDRRVHVGGPDVKGREEILKVHAKGKVLAENVKLDIIAKTTAGFTGADLENLLNEGAIIAAKEDKKEIYMEHINKALIKAAVGTEKKSKVISDKEKKNTAYHEAGHAILFHILPDMDPVHSISIIPTGPAGGYTMPLPQEDRGTLSKSFMRYKIMTLLGGRIAEKMIFDDITTGASNDIQRATLIAKNMVTKYGMSDKLGPIQYGSDSDEVFIGRDWGSKSNYSEEIAREIDSEIKSIINGCYDEAEKLLKEHIEILHSTSNLLLEKEKITGEEFEALFKKEEIKEKL